MREKLILIGAGGHCKACIDVIEKSGVFDIEGVLDSQNKQEIMGYPVIGSDAQIKHLSDNGYKFLITVGQVKNPALRRRIFMHLNEIGAEIATIISPFSHIARNVKIGRGSIVMHNAVLNSEAVVGANCILNTGCIIEHDVQIADNVHISTGAILNGGSVVGNDVFVGSNVTVSNQVRITDKVIIGAGSTVIKDIIYPGVYVGTPAKLIHQ